MWFTFIKKKEFLDEKKSIKNFINEYSSNEKSDKLNVELVKEYFDNMEKNVEKANKIYGAKKEEGKKDDLNTILVSINLLIKYIIQI